jgi:WD40 repeat protein
VLFSCSYDDSIKIWKLESSIDDWICTNTLKGHKSTVWQIDFSPCLKFLVSCS